MKSLKALVIGMGVLIVIGLGFLGYGVLRNLSPRSAAAPSVPVAAVAAGVGEAGYFNVDLPLAAGDRFEQMAVAGERIVLRFSGTDGDRLLVVDPKTGHVTGSIALVAPKP